MSFVFNVLISASVISFSAWLAGRVPTVAGFLVAMPISTMIVLPLAHVQHGDSENTILLAKSILVAIPVSLAFFVPFLLSGRFQLAFWPTYALACLALPVGFFLHRWITRWL